MATVAQPLRIAIDVDGGDHGAAVTLPAAAQFLARRPDAHLVLVGTEASLASAVKIIPVSVAGRVSHVIATEVVGMDESPALSLKNKKNSSLRLALNAVKDGQAAACVSAGNTGALMATARFVLKTLPGIDRPAIASLLPTHKGHGKEGDGGVLMLDLGANVDCTPEHLRQFAIMGAALSSALTDKPRPTVALLNIGEEEKKGDILRQSTYELMKEQRQYRFVGNVEGRDIFDPKADVMVCDGFTGNVVLKVIEGFHDLLEGHGVNDPFLHRFNYENYGGLPVLGVNGNVIIGHGISNALTIKNMILFTREVVASRLNDRIREALT